VSLKGFRALNAIQTFLSLLLETETVHTARAREKRLFNVRGVNRPTPRQCAAEARRKPDHFKSLLSTPGWLMTRVRADLALPIL
jgi:hypothetical protein